MKKEELLKTLQEEIDKLNSQLDRLSPDEMGERISVLGKINGLLTAKLLVYDLVEEAKWIKKKLSY